MLLMGIKAFTMCKSLRSMIDRKVNKPWHYVPEMQVQTIGFPGKQASTQTSHQILIKNNDFS